MNELNYIYFILASMGLVIILGGFFLYYKLKPADSHKHELSFIKDNYNQLSNSLNELNKKFYELGFIKDNYSQLSGNFNELDKKFVEFKTLTEALTGKADRLISNVNQADTNIKTNFASLAAEKQHSGKTQESILKALRSIDSVLIGSKSKGMLGENIIANVLDAIPDGKLIHNYSVNGNVVEFAYKLRSGIVVPIDSKFVGAELLDKLANTDDKQEAAKVQKELTNKIKRRALEAIKYINPPSTTSFVIVAVPEAAYFNSAEFFNPKIMITSYRMLLSYLLIIDEFSPLDAGELELHTVSNGLKEIERSATELKQILSASMPKFVSKLAAHLEDLQKKTNSITNSTEVLLMRLEHKSLTNQPDYSNK